MALDYQNLCDKIFEIDPEIRFVSVYDTAYIQKAGGMRKGIKSYLPEYTTQRSAVNAFLRKNTRLRLKKWIGVPQYAFAEYEKIKRFTFYLKHNHMLLISTGKDIDIIKVVTNVKKLIKTYAE